MNDNSRNKVCFDCAGVPVVRRIVHAMRAAGVTRFAVVVGHLAQTVMDALDGEEGVFYVYQKEQKGTGHAALCGLNALKSLGYDGPVIISMGDKIIAPSVISELLAKADKAKSVWGVLPLAANPQGGHVMVADGKPCGIVEMADAALMSLAGKDPSTWEDALRELGLNEKKSRKVLRMALDKSPSGSMEIAGKSFTAADILSTPYANAALYCFDLGSAVEAIGTLGSNNAQGEIYLTDTLEYFALKGEALLHEIADPEDMLTFSTKPELREIGLHFMRSASRFIEDLRSGALDATLADIYGGAAAGQKERYIALLEFFISRYGDEKVMITRSPGRVNLMGRHIDHRGGGINVMAIDRDIVFVTSMRPDDEVHIANIDPQFPERSFSIGATLGLADHSDWLGYLDAEPVVAALKEARGDWSNYVKSSVLRFQLESEMPLCGMNMAASGCIPLAAGLSSSSSIVVAVSEAVVALNCMNISSRRFIDLCGEGEWFVGSRGGAGDHAAMKCSRRGCITHLDFKPFRVGESVPFSDRYAIIVADTCTKAKKSEGSKDVFNSKVAAYEFAFMILKKRFPEYDMHEFRDIAEIRPFSSIYRMLKVLPEAATREELVKALPEYSARIAQIFASHADPGFYDLRGVTMFGVAECMRSKKCMDYLSCGNYAALGDMMKTSHDGDRLVDDHLSDRRLEELAALEFDVSRIGGGYNCSTERIDALCDLLNATPGVLGSQIVGAGLGGCIVALVEKSAAPSVQDVLEKGYYDKFGYPHSANVFVPSSGSAAIF
ncbi:MAG: NTP transferase domain-containing protein [Bacteroidales bacterium]|nr:NTP transferase domain-containing protein [Bacteroidales bacterium]